jgi:tetraacyldisaccharide 4'-kinase
MVVGNITVGGAGKTPLILLFAKWFTELGLSVGIVSRGYGGKAPAYPWFVTPETPTSQGGDEPCMIAQRIGLPVIVDPDRPRAVRALLEKWPQTDLVLSDDGLQHYAMDRAVEFVVIDGARRLGNGLCLPVGPLREPPARLTAASALVVNDGDPLTSDECGVALSIPQIRMTLRGAGFFRVQDDRPVPDALLREAAERPGGVIAFAGIGHPERFFRALAEEGLKCQTKAYPDHHGYVAKDFKGLSPDQWVLTTEKDAVKLRQLARPNWCYYRVEATLPEEDWEGLAAMFLDWLEPWPRITTVINDYVSRLHLRQSMRSRS